MATLPAQIHEEFAQEVLRGLVDLGPDAFDGTDLCLELGLSVWMRRSGADLDAALGTLGRLSWLVAEAGGLNPRCEPVALVGRSPEADVLSVVMCLGHLVFRAALTHEGDPSAIVEITLERVERERPERSRVAALA